MSRILVVDDEPDLRFIHRWSLTRAGHEVVEASDGQAALESVRQLPPDLVVTDMMMPVMGGAELIRRLRADPVTAQIPILAATADPQLASGADAVLPGFFQQHELVAMVNALLNKREDRA